jgi:CheY-like chemotaxis protein
MQAKALTSQLLTFSKGGLPLLETASALELMEHSASYVLKDSNAKVEICALDELWPLKIDVAQIVQVISNLVINSSQAMPEGGTIKICARNVMIGTGSHLPLKAGEYVRISVQDHGIGISEGHLQKVFEPYFTTKQEGSGLGLTISNLIIRNHNGHIAVESQEGVGTIFSVYLPASPEKVVTRNGAEENLMVGEGKILMVDDEDIVRDLARETLSSIGYKVTTAKDGAEAVELYRQAYEGNHPFNAVIMDLTIPGGMGGREAIRKLNEIDPEAKVIVSSGYSNDPVISNFRDYGFKGAIAKPYGVKELSEILYEVTAN